MYALRVAVLVSVAFAAVPAAHSAPLGATSRSSPFVPKSPIPARDHGPALSRDEIRDLLNHLNHRSEDVVAALSGRDESEAPLDPLLGSIIPRTVKARAPLDAVERDGLLDTRDRRSFFGSIGSAIDNTVSTFGDAANEVVNSAGGSTSGSIFRRIVEVRALLDAVERGELLDTQDRRDFFDGVIGDTKDPAANVGNPPIGSVGPKTTFPRTVEARALLDTVERDGLLDTQDRRSFFGSIESSIDNTVSDFGDAANEVVNSAGTSTSGSIFRRIVEARALLAAVERDGLLDDLQDLRRDLFSNVENNVGSAVGSLGDVGSSSDRRAHSSRGNGTTPEAKSKAYVKPKADKKTKSGARDKTLDLRCTVDKGKKADK